MAEYTPMMQQYFKIKDQYEDTILMYRLGDFYEMFFDDAQTASKELELTLTGRECGQEERAPMCGVPYHSVESYIARLISKGYKVAICEQTEDPAQAKGLVKREVIRMITPGTVMESSMLEDSKNNYLAAVYMDSEKAAVCSCDISTGEVAVAEGDDWEFVINQLGRIAPSEVILCDGAFSNPNISEFVKERLECHCEKAGQWRFAYETAVENIKKQFDMTLESRHMVQVVGGLLSYLYETQKNDLSHIKHLEVDSADQFMELNVSARRNLELTSGLHTGDKKGSLLWVLDNTKTSMGARLVRQWIEKPLLGVAQIKRRQSAVNDFVKNHEDRDRLEAVLSRALDMERIMGRIVYGTANCKDLRALWQVCCLLPEIKRILLNQQSKYLKELGESIDTLEDLVQLIDNSIAEEPPFSVREGGMIKTGFNENVDELRALLNGGTAQVAEIERSERERTGIKNLKIGYNKVFGYYIELSKSNIGQAPVEYIRKQTLANCERYITQELKKLEGEVLSAGDKLTSLEFEVFTQVRAMVAQQVLRVQKSAQAVATADVLRGFAQAAVKYNYTMPEIDNSDKLIIIDGRHPVVEQVLKGSLFVPNDVKMDCTDNRVYIITGPNMAGKSTYMRQVALIAIMAQCGSFVPAKSAEIGICDKVFTRIGASDDMYAGRSTFMVEMNEVADILKNATKKSLLILDEIGRGTSTFDGMSIAKAVIEYVADKKSLGAKTLFATHYHELCELEGIVDGVKNYNIAVKKRGDDIIFLKKIISGGANDSYGIEVGKLAGLPEKIIKRAKAVLKEIESKASVRVEKITDAEETETQFSLGTYTGQQVIEQLKAIEPDTLSPIEALSMLYDLCAKAKEN